MSIRGFIKNSRKEANFVSRLNSESRAEYIRLTAASYEWELLIPYVRITKIHRFYRQVDYSIKLPDIDEKKNERVSYVNHSRRNSDYLLSLKKKERDDSVKRFIAHCEANKLLFPYVRIIDHDESFRNIEYEIDIPSKVA